MVSDSFVKHIAVPKNKKGINECKQGTYSDSNVAVFDIVDEEFDQLYDEGIAQTLNEIEGVMFDEYESDYIPFEKLGECLKVFRESEKFMNCEFAKAIKAGMSYGFGIYTEF
jgi:hypothetical protein